MDQKTLIMLIIQEGEEGRAIGRTMLQKLGYFTNIFCDLGIEYRPYFYGPYSKVLSASLNSAVGLGLVRETCDSLPIQAERPFEPVRYEYRLSEGGRQVLQELIGHLGEQKIEPMRRTIRAILDSGAGYGTLSVAAKLCHVFAMRPGTRCVQSREDLQGEARQLGWDLPTTEINRGASLLLEILNRIPQNVDTTTEIP